MADEIVAGSAPATATDLDTVADETFDPSIPRLNMNARIYLDRWRNLRLPGIALYKFQKVTKINPLDFEAVWGWPPDPDVLFPLLWAALIHEDPNLTIEQVMELPGVELANIQHIRWALNQCYGEAMPPPDTDTTPSKNGAPPNARSRRA